MEKQVVSLINLIHKEVDSLENFLRLLTEEEECLINKHFDRLEESVKKQEQAIIQAKELEKERMEIAVCLSKDLKINQGEASISKLIQLLNSSYSLKLEELQKTLLELHRKVESQRERNEELIKESMGYIDRRMKFLLDNSPPSYWRRSLNDQGRTKPSLILDKVG